LKKLTAEDIFAEAQTIVSAAAFYHANSNKYLYAFASHENIAIFEGQNFQRVELISGITT
jgi:hypothetical protein